MHSILILKIQLNHHCALSYKVFHHLEIFAHAHNMFDFINQPQYYARNPLPLEFAQYFSCKLEGK